MQSPILIKLAEILKEENMKGNTVTLLTKGKNDYFPLEEHISYVKSISPEILDKGMRKVTLAFANKNVETRVFLDDNIKEGDFVATIGYFYTFNGILTYSAKGGMAKVLQNPKQEPQMYGSKTYRMGNIIKIARAEETEPYLYSSEIFQLEDSGFYYAVEESLKNSLAKITHKDNGIINTAELPEEPEVEEQEIEETEIKE